MTPLTGFRAFAPGDAVPREVFHVTAHKRRQDAAFLCPVVVYRWKGGQRAWIASYPFLTVPSIGPAAYTDSPVTVTPTCDFRMIVHTGAAAHGISWDEGEAEALLAAHWPMSPHPARRMLTALRKQTRGVQSEQDQAVGRVRGMAWGRT